VATVEENISGHTPRQVERARAARELYHNMGSPTVDNFKNLLRMNVIKNCPVTLEDIKTAEAIFGPAMSTLKGKTTRKKLKPIQRDEIKLPSEIKAINKQLELCIHIMYINGIPMLTTIDKTIKFCGLVPQNSKSHEEYYEALDQVLRFYNKSGYFIKTIFCDGEFKSLMEKVADELDIDMNYTNAQDHVPQAERNNSTIKERIWAAIHRLPYKKIPKTMVKYLAMVKTNLLNLFPVKGGVSKYFSPRTILTSETLDYNKHCKIPFGSYVQATHESNPSNTNIARTLDCIYLRPNKSIQEGHELLDLTSERVITGSHVKVISATQMVIDAVEKMAEDQGFKEFKFQNRHGIVYQDADWLEGVDDDDEYFDNDEYIDKTDMEHEPIHQHILTSDVEEEDEPNDEEEEEITF